MPTLSFGSGPAKNFGFTGEVPVPELQKFPVGTVIPYYGNDPVLSGWARYSQADGRFVYGLSPTTTATYAQLGVVAPEYNFGIDFIGSLGSGGSHSGPNVVQNIYSTGSLYAATGAGGAHTHSVSGGGRVASSGILNTQKVTLLRATTSAKSLPVNSLVIQQTQPSNSTAFARTGSNFLVGANNDQTFTARTGSVSVTATPSVVTDGNHYHSSTARGTQVPAGQRFYAYYVDTYSGSHTHTMGSTTATQGQIDHKLVNLWQLTAQARASAGMIVMYVNTVAPPASWAICNGLNGTPNLGNYYIGYSNNQWDIVVNSDATSTGIGAVASAYISHAHNSSYSPANLAQGSYPGIVTTAQHNTYGWSHTHTNNVGVSFQSYLPPRINVAFIMYKG